jgi:hypothetical protein
MVAMPTEEPTEKPTEEPTENASIAETHNAETAPELPGATMPLLPGVPPLPDNSVLLHIGVHKTGTTAIQAALADARGELRQAGVYYPGKRPAQHRAALSVLQRPWGWVDRGAEVFDRSSFDALAGRVVAFDGRTVISSEFFCEASEETALEVVQALGGDNVHVVVTLRSLGALLPSSWQQYLKFGLATGYFKWLRNVFENPGGSSITPTFWMRHDHEAVIRRWLAAVGPERMTVVVLEGVDRRAIFRTFEQLLDLPAGTLESRMNLTSNRSMTAIESQLLVELNRQVALDLDWIQYQRFVRRGLALRMVEDREPPPEEPRLYTPVWALEAAAEMGQRAADYIRGTGVRVLGDLDALGLKATTGTRTNPEERKQIPAELAVAALKAVIELACEPPDDEVVSTRQLANELWGRVKADGRARWTNRSLRKP